MAPWAIPPASGPEETAPDRHNDSAHGARPSFFTPQARARRHVVGDRWHVDETYLKVRGTWRYLFRAIDQFGQVIDVYLSHRRDAKAARRFLERAIGRTRISPVEVTTDRYRVYPRPR